MKLSPAWHFPRVFVCLCYSDLSSPLTCLHRLACCVFGHSVETVEYKNISFTVWDVGGQDKIRALWRHYYSGCEGIIYVVDSLDRDRMGLARDTLKHMLLDDELRNAHVLVLANKQDMPNSMSAAEMADKLELSSIRGRNWHCQPCCAVSAEGLYEGLDWMCAQMAKSR